MIEKGLRVGAGFDWISPLWAMVQDYRNRPAVRFMIPADCGWHAFAIRNLLRANGVKLWGLALYQDTFVFSVRLAQHKFTCYLLQREGIPYRDNL